MSDFRKALLWTAIPIAVMAVAPVFIAGGGILLIVLAALCVAAMVAAIVFAATRRSELAGGTLAGLGIGLAVTILAMMASCFVVHPGG